MKKDKMARIFNFLQTFAGAFYKVKKIAQLLNFSQKQKKTQNYCSVCGSTLSRCI
jgi:hypothetical protein